VKGKECETVFSYFIRIQWGDKIMAKMCSKTGLPGRNSAYRENTIGDVYSYKQCIRTFHSEIGYIFNVTKYSTTTSHHQSISHKTAEYPKIFKEVVFSSESLVTPDMMIAQARKQKEGK